MKKLIYNIALLAATSLLGVSCNDSFLDRNPTNDLNDKSFWNAENDLEVYNNGIYNEASDDTYYTFMTGHSKDAWSSSYSGLFWHDVQTDNFVSKSNANHTSYTKIAAGKETVPTKPGAGGWHWTLLRRINVFFENYTKTQAVESIKEKYAGEAYFFRAWFYLDKVQMYGDVPYIDKPLTTASEDLYGPRTPRKTVMDKVLIDINNACDRLPEDWGKNKPSRITKGAALALKSRICLYEGTYRKYHKLGDHEKFLQEAVKAAEDLMKLKKYSIHNTGNPGKDYTTLFTSDDLESNKEVILYKKYVSGLLGHRLCGYIVASGTGATKDFVEDFLCKEVDGTALPVSLSQSYSDESIENELDNRDPRLTQIILDPRRSKEILYNRDKFIFPRVTGMTNWESATGYHAIKYYSAEQDKKGYGNEVHDAPLLRYAEVLLNLVEAKAELQTITQDDLDNTINLLRNRAGMPPLTMNPVMDPKYKDEGISPLLVEIRRERRVELCFEDSRYQDLMRWKQGSKLAKRVLGMRFEPSYFDLPRFTPAEGKADPNRVKLFKVGDKNYINVFAGTDWENRTFDESKHYLHPIPVNVMSKNEAILQNPGWE